MKFGLQELALSQCVFATDYPQAIRDPGEVDDYVKACEALDPNANALVHGLNAEKLIPDIRARVRAIRLETSIRVPFGKGLVGSSPCRRAAASRCLA